MPAATATFSARAQQAWQQALAALSAAELAIARDTSFTVQDRPTDAQLRLVRAGPGDIMTGLYTQPPPAIVIFQASIETLGYPLRYVVDHELQHRLGYDHSLDVVAKGCGVPAGQEIPDTHGPWMDDCPICALYGNTAHASSLLNDLVEASSLQQKVPLGLGGTIPLIRRDLLRTRALIPQVSKLMPGRQGQMRSLQGCVGRAVMYLAGQNLGLDQLRRAQTEVSSCRKQSYLVAWSFFARRRG